MTPHEFRRWRKKHGWTQKEAAARLGVALVTLRFWEMGINPITTRTMTTMALLDQAMAKPLRS